MKYFLFALALSSSVQAVAFESTMTFATRDLKKNELVVSASGDDDAQIPATASTVLTRQLQASQCSHVLVMPQSMKAAPSYDFKVTSDNCVVKSKTSGEECEPGFLARNIEPNAYSKKDVVIGATTYKVCLKDPGGASSQSKKPVD